MRMRVRKRMSRNLDLKWIRDLLFQVFIEIGFRLREKRSKMQNNKKKTRAHSGVTKKNFLILGSGEYIKNIQISIVRTISFIFLNNAPNNSNYSLYSAIKV